MHTTYETYTDKNQQEIPVLGLFSLWFGAGLVGITAVANIITFQSGGMSGATAVAETFRVILFALILASIGYLIWQVGSGSLFVAAMPLIINLFTLIIIQFVPFAAVWEEINFQVNSNRLNKVVDMVETGQLQPNPDGSLALPFSYRALSAGGDIQVEHNNGATSIFFISSQQSQHDIEGFIYRSDGRLPHDEFGGNWTYVAAKRPFWFYCARH
ncbi:MAG: hypothetical protein IAF02_16225 [Anaerolineae bacterium]|nr:hypothetical protein [Anaerolineae bacterium]